MRKTVLLGLLAATLVPGLAQAQSYGEVRDSRRELRQEQRDVNRAIRNGAPGYVVRDERRDVRDARREVREDWRDYRRTHPDVYRAGRYVGPRGYAYRPVAVGYRFAPSYYQQRYWLDANRYRLAPVYGSQRWIRYGNDAVLIDSRNGRTIRVYNRFFN
jgi:Ni/Co efflux regulator RcnB